MKLPEIPLPEPVFMITLTRGTSRGRRTAVQALRFALWMGPAAAVETVLGYADGGAHSRWLTLAAAYLVLIIAVLTVNVRDGGTEEP